MRARRGPGVVLLPLVLAMLISPAAVTWAQDGGGDGVDPLGPPEGPIPFPIVDVSSSFDEDRFPSVLADDGAMHVVWNKGARDMFTYHVVHRRFDGEALQEGEDWVSVPDVTDHDFEAHEHYSHEGVAARMGDLLYFVFASDDPDYTTDAEHDIVLRSYDPATGEWGPVLEVTPADSGQDREPNAVVLGDRLVIAWRTNDPGKAEGMDEDIVLRTYDGVAFSDIYEVSPDGDSYADAKLDMLVVGDAVSIVWEWNNRTRGPSDWDVLYRVWDGTGFTSPPVRVSPDDGRVAKLPKLAALDGEPFVVFESRPAAGRPGAVGVKGRMIEGTVPGAPVDITRPGSGSENVQPDAVTVGGDVYVFWSSFDDSITHGPDSDIVYRRFDGEELGEVVEVSHPRDGSDVDDGFVTACLFQGNLYAVWRMLFLVETSQGTAFDEDIVMRRVTDYRVDIGAEAESPLVGREVELSLAASTISGEPRDAKELGVTVTVMRDLEALPVTIVLEAQGEGRYTATFLPDQAGTHTFIAAIDGREISSATVTIYEDGGDGDGDGSPYVWYTLAGLVLLLLALLYAWRSR